MSIVRARFPALSLGYWALRFFLALFGSFAIVDLDTICYLLFVLLFSFFEERQPPPPSLIGKRINSKGGERLPPPLP